MEDPPKPPKSPGYWEKQSDKLKRMQYALLGGLYDYEIDAELSKKDRYFRTMLRHEQNHSNWGKHEKYEEWIMEDEDDVVEVVRRYEEELADDALRKQCLEKEYFTQDLHAVLKQLSAQLMHEANRDLECVSKYIKACKEEELNEFWRGSGREGSHDKQLSTPVAYAESSSANANPSRERILRAYCQPF